jgi:hypothetical protein
VNGSFQAKPVAGIGRTAPEGSTTATPSGILVLGAGELGMAVLRPLQARSRQANIKVDVLLRPAVGGAGGTDRSALEALGASLVVGDVAALPVEELAKIFARYDTVISCIGFAGGSGTQVKLARAALAASVRRYLPWQFGVDYDVLGRGSAQPLFDEQLDVRDLLRGQNRVEWIIVSTGMFTSFLFEPAFRVVDLEGGIVRALGGWDNAVTVTTPDDIGRMTTEILFAQPRIANEVVHLAGDTLTYGALADIVERALRRPIERSVWDVPTLRSELAHDPEDAFKRYRAVFAQGPGMAWDKAATFNGRRGIALTDVEGWLRTHLAPSAGKA